MTREQFKTKAIEQIVASVEQNAWKDKTSGKGKNKTKV